MAKPVYDFGRAIQALWRHAWLLSLVFVGLFLAWAGFRVAEAWRVFHAIHPLAGAAFLLAFVLAFAWLIGRPALAFLRVPRVLRPPDLPDPSERTPADLLRHLAYVERYVEGLPRNPEWGGSPEEVERTMAACRALAAEARGAARDALPALSAKAAAIEGEHVARLLLPLDRRAAEEIRGEALRVGVATAVSPYGSLDAFLVLWRNVNLVARVARIYYGRPGPRGTLRVVRDAAGATMASAYLQDLSEIAGDAVASFTGKAAGVLAGPLLDGTLNAVATLRIGYVAKARCRAFSAWTVRTRGAAMKAALGEAARFSGGLVKDVVKTVGGGILSLPGKALGALVEKVASLFRRAPEGEGPAPASP
jgi:hypothetical protein